MDVWQNIRFENLPLLNLLWAVPALFAVVVYGFARKRRALMRFASAGLLGRLVPDVSQSKQWTKAMLVLAAMVMIVLAITDPRWGVRYEHVERRGIDVIFVLDVSRSMLADDLAPNRLERAKQYIGDVLEVLAGDRVGLVTFAGSANLKCPLTINYGAYRMALEEVVPRAAHRGGSLIGDAIRLAADSFVDEIKEHKAIIVLTDGGDQESYPVEAARQAYEERGIRVFTVGLGDATEGARIPIIKDGKRFYLRHEGEEVWTKMEPAILRSMAEAGGGSYVPAGTRPVDLGQIYLERVGAVEQREFEAEQVKRYNVQYQWFAGLALALLMIETWMSERRRVAAMPVGVVPAV